MVLVFVTTLKLVDLGGGEASWGGRDGGGRTGIVELEMWLRVVIIWKGRWWWGASKYTR